MRPNQPTIMVEAPTMRPNRPTIMVATAGVIQETIKVGGEIQRGRPHADLGRVTPQAFATGED